MTTQVGQISKEDLSDRRQHRRYSLRKSAFAGFRPNMGEIVDISTGGVLFHYLEFAKGVSEKDDFMICSEDGCCLDNFPCRVVSDTMLASESSLSKIITRQRRVMFHMLTEEQQGLLNDFIDTHRTV